MPTFANFSSIAVHNTYLYWPLRTGILGSVAFLWMLARMGKASLIMRRFVKTEEDHFYSVLAINILVIYMVGCFFGLLYGDGIIIIGIYQVALQLMMEEKLPGLDMRKILFWRTMFSREIVMKSSSLPAKTA
jgi:O-antigen ligase